MNSESWGPITATPSERRALRTSGTVLLLIAIAFWFLATAIGEDGFPLKVIAGVVGFLGAFLLFFGLVASPHHSNDEACVD